MRSNNDMLLRSSAKTSFSLKVFGELQVECVENVNPSDKWN